MAQLAQQQNTEPEPELAVETPERSSSTEVDIENRAVTREWLARLTTTEVNEDMKAAASLTAIEYLQARLGDHRQAVLTEGSSVWYTQRDLTRRRARAY